MHWRFWERRIPCPVCERQFSEREWRRAGSPEHVVEHKTADFGFGVAAFTLYQLVCSAECAAILDAEKVLAEA